MTSTSTSEPPCSKFPNIVLNPTPLRYAPPGTEPLVKPTTTDQSQTSTAPSAPPAPESTTTPSQVPKKSKKRSRPPKTTEETTTKEEATPVTANDGTQTPPVAKRSRKAKGEDSPVVSSEFKRPDWLPEEWSVREHVREQGKSAGTRDKYYIEPVTGKRFRSQREVQRHLGIAVETPSKATPQKREFSGEGKNWTIDETAANGEKNKETKSEEGGKDD